MAPFLSSRKFWSPVSAAKLVGKVTPAMDVKAAHIDGISVMPEAERSKWLVRTLQLRKVPGSIVIGPHVDGKKSTRAVQL